jgi:hypothetical protein
MSKLGSAIKKIKSAMTGKKKTSPVVTPKKATGKEITVRFSTNKGTWVEVDPEDLDNVLRALPLPSYMTNVEFSTHSVYTSHGCGSSVEGKAGVAKGLWTADRPADMPATGLDNLGFGRTASPSAVVT